jgi:hypothetical protein
VSITPPHVAAEIGQAEQLELVIQEAQVERRVVDDDFGALDVVAQFSAISWNFGLSLRNSVVRPWTPARPLPIRARD